MLEAGWMTSEILYMVVAEDGVDFTVRFLESMWAISRDSGYIGVANNEDRHLRGELGKEAQGVLPKILVFPVRSMNVEDGNGVSLVLDTNCLEAVFGECLVLVLQTGWVWGFWRSSRT